MSSNENSQSENITEEVERQMNVYIVSADSESNRTLATFHGSPKIWII
jgi:hypothetical protein